MVLKDSAQEPEKDIHASSRSKDLGEDEHTDLAPKPFFPGSKQIKHIISGGIAGAISRTCVSPLERVKILLQIQVRNPKFSGVGATLIKIGKEEGLRGYFKGNGTNVLRIIPYSAVQFAAYEEFKKLLNIPEDLQTQTPMRRLLAGGLAGTTSVIATYPLDLVRTRLAAQGEGAEKRYRNIFHAFQTILKDEGGLLSGCLYKGLPPTVMGIAPYIGLNFAVYETLKDFVLGHFIVRARGAELKRMDKDRELPVVVRLLCGGLAGGISQTVTYPLDVVRRRMQMKGISGDLFAYTSTRHAFTTIVQVEGIKGLYKGMWPNLLKIQVSEARYTSVTQTLVKIGKEEGLYGYFKGNGTNIVRIVPYTAIQFAAYEEFKKLLKIPEDTREQHPVMRLTAGALAGIVSSTATYPLDLIRTRLAVQGEGSERRYRNIRHACVTIVKEEGGLFSGCLFRGLGPSLIGIAPYIGLNFAVYESLKGYVMTYYHAEAGGHKLRMLTHEQDLPVVVKLSCGAVAGAIAQTGTYPLDVVRRRMQMKGASGELFKYNSTWHAFNVIIKTEGVRGLFKGMWPNLLKVAPTIGIQFAVYEVSKSMLHNYSESL